MPSSFVTAALKAGGLIPNGSHKPLDITQFALPDAYVFQFEGLTFCYLDGVFRVWCSPISKHVTSKPYWRALVVERNAKRIEQLHEAYRKEIANHGLQDA